MVQDNNELEIINECKKILKPRLFVPIWNTIIGFGPPCNLIFRYFLERDIKNPTFAIVLTIIAIIWIIINWYWYVKEKINFEKKWKEISVELEAIDNEEKSTKDYGDLIFNKLQITVIASLVSFFVFCAIVLISKLSFFKNLMLLSILIFILSSMGMIIIGIIEFFKYLKNVKKEKRLKSVLKRFILIFFLLFIIQMSSVFIMHKSIEWFRLLLTSLAAAMSFIMATEVVFIYKGIIKELSANTSSDEDDSN